MGTVIPLHQDTPWYSISCPCCPTGQIVFDYYSIVPVELEEGAVVEHQFSVRFHCDFCGKVFTAFPEIDEHFGFEETDLKEV